jgi:M6 family metalloprotease-like protein
MLSVILLSAASTPGWTVPAYPGLVNMRQPDGSTILVRRHGDEWFHWSTTVDGQVVARDARTGYWRPAPMPVRPLSPRALRPASATARIPTAGVNNLAVILVTFPDKTTTYGPSDFSSLLFGAGAGSMASFYREASYGRFTVSAGPSGVVGWYTAAHNHDYYGYAGGFGPAAELAEEAVRAADAAGFDFSAYDQDGNGYADSVCIIHQGAGAEASDDTNIWSHSWGISPYLTRSGVYVSSYVMQPEMLWGAISTVGVYCHEYGHALGLPDLYDTDYTSAGLGSWSLMAGGSWNGSSGNQPAHPDAWCKIKLGWVTPTVVTGSLTAATIPSVETTATVYKLFPNPNVTNEYFLVENRQRTGFDTPLPGSGLCVYHVDDNVGGNSAEWYPGHTNNGHYHVALLQADGLFDLERNRSANAGDPYPGTTGNRTLNSASTPNTNTYAGSSNAVAVANISNSGALMTADLTAESTFTIAGTVRNAAGAGLGGVSVATTGASTTTAADGAYTLRGLAAGSYTVSATQAEKTFSSVKSQPIAVNGTVGSATGADFVGTTRTYSLTGQVRNAAGTGLAGVAVATTGAATTTSADGAYTLSGLVAGSYTVTASKAEMTFSSVKTQPLAVNETVGSATGVDFTGAARTYTIAGKVRDAAGSGIAGVSLATTGAATTTAADGAYTLSGLLAGSYTVTASKAERTLSSVKAQPITVNETVGNATGVDFTGTVKTYSLSGQVRNAGGTGLAGVSVATTGATTTTTGDGTYTLTGLVAGSYTVTASRSEMIFSSVKTQPLAVNETVGSATGVDFTGAARTYTIAGTVRDGAGHGLAGVTLATTGAVTTTAADGTYTLSGLVAGTHTVTPQLPECSFSPSTREVTVNETTGNVLSQNFTAQVLTYSISGAITRDGSPLAGVLVTATDAGGVAKSALTVADGTYLLSGLLAGSYTVSAAKVELTFTALQSQPVALSEAVGNVSSVNFTASPCLYTISGTIKDAAAIGLAGVSVSAGGKTVLTDADGVFALEGLVARTYKVTPTLAEWSFSPLSRSVTVSQSTGSATGVTLAGTRRQYRVAGYVHDRQGAVLPGVRMTLGDLVTTTDAGGHYQFDNLVAGAYTVTAQLAEYSLAPVSRTATVNQATGSTLNQSFVGTARTYPISGTVTLNGNPLARMLVTAAGGTSRSALTAANGTYTILGLPAGTYTVTAARNETLFSPPTSSVSVNETTGGASGVDFAASTRLYALAGKIADSAGAGVAGVSVTAGGKTVRTAADGSYTLAGLVARTYTVTPKLAEWTFAPTSRSVTVNQTTGNATGVDLVGTPRRYRVGGFVRDHTGAGVSGVEIATGSLSTTTDASGHYQFDSLAAGTYLVTPQLAGQSFRPASRTATVNEAVGSTLACDFALNTAPVLAWSGDAGYTADGVNPDQRNAAGDFVFAVRYSDLDGDPPAYVKVRVWGPGGTTELIGSPFVLRCWSTAPDWKTGAIFGARLSLATAGTYSYQFLASDGLQEVRFLAAPRSGPTVGTAPAGALAVSGAAAQPLAGGASVTYALSAPADMEVVVLNIAGRLIAQLPAGPQEAGVRTLQWNGRNQSGSLVPSGVYLIRLTARTPDGAQTQTVVALNLQR